MLGGFLVKFALSQLSFIYILSTSSDSSTPVQIPLPQCSFTYPSLVSSPLQATVQFPLLLEHQFRFLSSSSNSSVSSQQFHSKQRIGVAKEIRLEEASDSNKKEWVIYFSGAADNYENK